MQNDKFHLPLEIYYKHLTKINGVNFTSREVDILSCLLNNRTAAISSFLGIAPRAVESHMRNIRQKAGDLPGRDNIIDFIEKSDRLLLIRNDYYNSLRLRVLFEEKLKVIERKIADNPSSCVLIYEKKGEYSPYLIPYLKEHLKRVGFGVSPYVNEKNIFSRGFTHSLKPDQNSYILYILPSSFDKLFFKEINTFKLASIIFVLQQEVAHRDTYEILKNLVHVNVAERNYYFSFFKILKFLLPHIQIEGIVEEFKHQYEHMKEGYEPKGVQEILNKSQNFSHLSLKNIFIRKRPQVFLTGLISAISISILVFSIMSKGGKQEFSETYLTTKQLKAFIRTDLILPSDSTLLQRPELIKQIDDGFKNRKGIQTVALIGIGGSGKTTVARYYTKQQENKVIWEINAETNASLIESFEKLAQTLSRTEEDIKILRGLRESKNFSERKEGIISFVKERLNLNQPWLLIYDNVENFADIRSFFPQDRKIWGEGRIILTTRNNNLQNNHFINQIIHIRELNKDQKFKLFTQIMHYGKKEKLSVAQEKEISNFLGKIPPFPLDISVAAYYVKTMEISYAKYLEQLHRQDENFTALQQNLLKEAGDYANTRYNIITLSLKQVMNIHKDFSDLLLFISLLDSQNIPRSLLDLYKNSTLVDNFIYYLQKYSLITAKFSIPSVGRAISLHRSTQAIAFAYLKQDLKIEENKLSLAVIDTLERHIEDMLNTENVPLMFAQAIHLNSVLSHPNILTDAMKGSIQTGLGRVYIYLDNHIPGAQLLKGSLANFEKCTPKNYGRIATTLGYLGLTHYKLGNYDEAINYFERSLLIYSKHIPQEYKKISWNLMYLGDIYREIGQYKKAEQLLEESLLVCDKYFPAKHIVSSDPLTHLGNLHKDLGNYQKAKDLLGQSYSIYKVYLPDNHIKIARALVHLGNVHRDLGNFRKSKEFLEKGLKIYVQNYPKNHSKVGWVLICLGNVYRDLKNYKQAEDLLQQGLKIYKNFSSENHPRMGWVFNSLGNLYADLGNYEQAKRLFNKSLEIFKSNYEKNHNKTAYTLEYLGQAYLKEGDLKAAEECLNKSLNILSTNHHPSIHITLESLSDLYLKKSEESTCKAAMKESQYLKTQAINELRKSLEIVKKHYSEDSPHIIRIERKLKNMIPAD